MNMMDEQPQQDVLPDKKNRNPVIYAVLYTDANGNLNLEECPSRLEAKHFINQFPNTESIVRVYRVSQTLELKQKTVVHF
jgi:hypothetical protein